jgi:hypothetical protein
MANNDEVWADNNIQFPRLLAEINANVTIEAEEWEDLKTSMDLSQEEITELFDRAEAEWETIKANLNP